MERNIFSKVSNSFGSYNSQNSLIRLRCIIFINLGSDIDVHFFPPTHFGPVFFYNFQNPMISKIKFLQKIGWEIHDHRINIIYI